MAAIRTNCRCGRVAHDAIGRRDFLRRAGSGSGMLALADLLGRDGLLASESDAVGPRAPKAPHFAARARSVIWLFMDGGPGAMDTFDPKPELDRHHGQKPGSSIDVFSGSPGPLMRSPFGFKRHDASGAWVCDRLPHLARHVDDMALTQRRVVGDVWAWHRQPGLARLRRAPELPGQQGGAGNWGDGFLPSAYQATSLRARGSPILNLDPPDGMTHARQRRMLDLAARRNAEHADTHPGEYDLLARIQNYELAYRMQGRAVEAVDLASEPEHVRRLYGLDDDATRPFGEKCLIARRMVERGVRFVQVYCNDEWDAQNDLRGTTPPAAWRRIARPPACRPT